jgi:hypothetical protein
MKLTQLSVFAENKPGHMLGPCRVLAAAGVNLRALWLADTQHFGILRMIVSEPQKAAKLLEEAGFLVKATEVLAIRVPDRPGGLVEVLSALEGTSINIEYMYSFPVNRGQNAVLLFRFSDADAALERLQAAGISLIGGEELLGQ